MTKQKFETARRPELKLESLSTKLALLGLSSSKNKKSQYRFFVVKKFEKNFILLFIFLLLFIFIYCELRNTLSKKAKKKQPKKKATRLKQQTRNRDLAVSATFELQFSE